MKLAPTRTLETIVTIAILIGPLPFVFAGLISASDWLVGFIMLGVIVHTVFTRRRGPQTFLEESLDVLDSTSLNLSQHATQSSKK